jgi:hypothetical protein
MERDPRQEKWTAKRIVNQRVSRGVVGQRTCGVGNVEHIVVERHRYDIVQKWFGRELVPEENSSSGPVDDGSIGACEVKLRRCVVVDNSNL